MIVLMFGLIDEFQEICLCVRRTYIRCQKTCGKRQDGNLEYEIRNFIEILFRVFVKLWHDTAKQMQI